MTGVLLVALLTTNGALIGVCVRLTLRTRAERRRADLAEQKAAVNDGAAERLARIEARARVPSPRTRRSMTAASSAVDWLTPRPAGGAA